MDYNYSVNMLERQTSETLWGILAIYGIILLLFGLFGLISYIFKGMGMYTIAKREGMEYPWLAFIPFARVYLQGELSGTVQLKRKSIKNPGIWLIALPIISSVIFSVFYTVVWGIFMGTMIALNRNTGLGTGSLMGILVIIGIFVLINIAYQVVLKTLRVLVNHQIYGKFTSKNMSIVHGLIGVFVPLYESICMFVMRNKAYNSGMEPKFETQFRQPSEQVLYTAPYEAPRPVQPEVQQPVPEPVQPEVQHPAQESVQLEVEPEQTTQEADSMDFVKSEEETPEDKAE